MIFCKGYPAIALVAAFCGTAEAQQAHLMPVPTRIILPGEPLDTSDFTMKLFTASDSLRKSFAFDPKQFERMEASRPLAAGKPVALKALRVSENVKKGQPTKAIYASPNVEIHSILIPQTGGSAGTDINARNPVSGQMIRAKILEDGTLQVIAR
jgi:flagellar basal body P-ring formation protein FlgA